MKPIEARILAALPVTWTKPREIKIPAAYLDGLDNTHLVSLRRMVPKGWVERRDREVKRGGAFKQYRGQEYRITTAGAQALANHQALIGAVKARKSAA